MEMAPRPLDTSHTTPTIAGPRGIQSAPPSGDIDVVRPLSAAPLVYPVTVGWGDCDPAQIAYSANVPAWGLRAVEAWYRACLGADWYAMNLDHGVGTPFVRLAYDFRSPVTPRAPLLVTVWVARLGRGSLAHALEGRQDGALRFTGRMTAAFVDATVLTPIPIPPNMRASIAAYVRAQGPLPEWLEGPERQAERPERPERIEQIEEPEHPEPPEQTEQTDAP